jgi:hypothetical protein
MCGYYFISDGGYPKFKYLVSPLKWHQSDTYMELWYDAVEATRKDTERTFGSMKKRSHTLVTPITNRLAFRVEQICIVCCVLHNRLLDYNDADNWHQQMIIFAHQGEQDDYVPMTIDNDHSFLCSHYRNDPELLQNCSSTWTICLMS